MGDLLINNLPIILFTFFVGLVIEAIVILAVVILCWPHKKKQPYDGDMRPLGVEAAPPVQFRRRVSDLPHG